MRTIILITLLTTLCINLIAQQQSFSDPAQQYNRLLIEKSSGSYFQIQNFKVIGTPYLFGGGDGVIYIKGTITGTVNYNTYNQQVELVVNPKNQPTLYTAESIDSFTMNVDLGVYKSNLKFVNASRINEKNNFFLQEVIRTNKYTLYKKYFSTFEIVPTNYIQSELRQFALNYDYYFLDSTNNNLTKIKVTENGLKKEFIDKKSCFASFDFSALSADKENVLKSFFQIITDCR